MARRTGQVVTGLTALVVLIGLLGGAPVALVAFAGNPLPDHLPGLAELGRLLTSRDDGQLFLRALALLGWAGWATFALSVLVELPARAMRRPALRLPGLSRQQRAAAALVGSVALILAASPAATASVTAAAPVVATAPYGVGHAAWYASGPVASYASESTTPYASSMENSAPVAPAVGPAVHAAPAPGWLAGPEPADEPVPVYRVERGDYLGHIAGRYLGDFNSYPELAKLNKIRNPDRIRPGQLLRLPPRAADHGVREHATGLVAVPPAPGGRAGSPPESEPADPPVVVPARPAPDVVPAQPVEDGSTIGVGAARQGPSDGVNRPLAISAVLSLAGILGAQVGAALGLRRTATGRGPDGGRHRGRR
ncbi:LysM peptidoglycan-binding domain-containing protein [Micromonospora zhanjiangensis]|uniref:LysM peptidoglycan-binding domain-containing protein n=1 Tax=Micromonospora zhanjiangensis TaxID=1522057 RepID=A0ABV8KUF1_9ACTN